MKISSIVQKINDYRKKNKAMKDAKKPQTFTEALLSWVKTVVGALVFVMILHSLLIASFIVPTGSMENTVMTGDFLLVNKLFGPSTPQIIPFFNIPLPYKMLPSLSDPDRGDVIVFVFPGTRDEIEAKEFQYYLKRCIALPGDTLQIIDNLVYVNGKPQPLAENGIVLKNQPKDPMEVFRTFPKGANFTHDNYGPVRIPKKGDTVLLHAQNYQIWDTFIMREGHQISISNGAISIDSRQTDKYVVEQDYYFGMGDNRDCSSDSRYWGFIPRRHILGSPIFCWLSWEIYDENNHERSLFGKLANIRWSRIGSCIN